MEESLSRYEFEKWIKKERERLEIDKKQLADRQALFDQKLDI